MPDLGCSLSPKPDPLQIQLSGYGGQGLILAGVILAQAAVKDGFYVIQTQAYGPEARGGASRADVMISAKEIDYPHIEQPDVLLALSQEACDKYAGLLSPDGVLVADSLFVTNIPASSARVFHLPIIHKAKTDLGKEMVANIVALGALNQIVGLVSWPLLEDAILERVPAKYANLNLQALEAGKELIT
jgi:2-oxoglutarate ferredoxin oxidoreductase subunit gamma